MVEASHEKEMLQMCEINASYVWSEHIRGHLSTLGPTSASYLSRFLKTLATYKGSIEQSIGAGIGVNSATRA